MVIAIFKLFASSNLFLIREMGTLLHQENKEHTSKRENLHIGHLQL